MKSINWLNESNPPMKQINGVAHQAAPQRGKAKHSPSIHSLWWLNCGWSCASLLFLLFRNNEEWIVVGYGPEAPLPQHHSAPQLILLCSASAALPHLCWFIKRRRALRQLIYWRVDELSWLMEELDHKLITNHPQPLMKSMSEGAALHSFNQPTHSTNSNKINFIFHCFHFVDC